MVVSLIFVILSEQETKESIRRVTNDIELRIRQMKSNLHQIHSRHSDIQAVCTKVKDSTPAIKQGIPSFTFGLNSQALCSGFSDLQNLLHDHEQATRYVFESHNCF